MDWKTAVFILPSTWRLRSSTQRWLEDCRITTSFYCWQHGRWDWKIGRLPYYYFLLLLSIGYRRFRGLEDCRIYTSFYWKHAMPIFTWIGRLPYLYFLLLWGVWIRWDWDWNTAVFILPSTLNLTKVSPCLIGRLPYLYFLLLDCSWIRRPPDWKTAVFILPSTSQWTVPH